MVILPETEKMGAVALAEQIRQSVEKLAIPHSESTGKKYVTISLGVVSAHTTMFTEPEQLIDLADEALYRAKQGGRNQIAIAQTEERKI